MVDINLLPWREEEYKKDKKTFLIHALICLIVIIFILLPIHLNYLKKVNRQDYRNTVLKNELAVISTKVKKLKVFRKRKAALKKKISALEALQYRRYQIVTLFNEITQLMPKGIFLNKMAQEKGQIILHGRADSHLLISELIKKIDLSQQLFTPTLSNVTTMRLENGNNVTKFQIALKLKPYKPSSKANKKS